MSAFDKVIGYESVKDELFQVIDIFKNEKIYKDMGAKVPKGILIYGNPGMGKTMLAEALIKECGVDFFILTKHRNTNETIREINRVFDEASSKDKAIILIDDMDKFSDSIYDEVDDAAFAAIQCGIDKVKYKDVLIVATANDISKLPRSLIRNGRFDRRIFLVSPTKDDAKEIMKFYLMNKKLAPSFNYEDLSRMIAYTSCADLKTVINESAIYATYQRKQYIEMDDIVKAYLKDSYVLTDKNNKKTDKEVIEVAFHEAGHAVVGEVLKENSVGFISILDSSRKTKEGVTQYDSDDLRRPEHVLLFLGGKAAVELFLEGRCGSGCQSDLVKAQELIRDGITESGTNGIGLVSNSDHKSDSLQLRIESCVQSEIEKYMFIVKDILIKNKEFLFKLKDELISKRYLLNSDIQKIRSSVTINKNGVVI